MNRKDETRILLAEDDETSSRFISHALEQLGYTVTCACDGAAALQEYKKSPYRVVITDINMPRMDGAALIDELVNDPFHPVIFVTTTDNSPAMIIDIMKKGVFDYLLKPVDSSELRIKVARAFDIYEMKRSAAIMEREKILRLEEQLDWYRWEDRTKGHGEQVKKETLFHNLQVSFNQGAGFGSLITLLRVISQSARREGSEYVIDAGLFEVVEQNVEMAEKALTTFSDIERIMSNPPDRSPVPVDQFFSIIDSCIDSTSQYAGIKNHKVLTGEIKGNPGSRSISVDSNLIARAFTELLMNAYKFSRPDSTIVLLPEVHHEKVVISILNAPITDEKKRQGIPMEYENLVLEPFFRLTKMIQEEYQTLDFGLGLTEVEKIISRHAGRITVMNITDHSDIRSGPQLKVSCAVSLPVSE